MLEFFSVQEPVIPTLVGDSDENLALMVRFISANKRLSADEVRSHARMFAEHYVADRLPVDVVVEFIHTHIGSHVFEGKWKIQDDHARNILAALSPSALVLFAPLVGDVGTQWLVDNYDSEIVKHLTPTQRSHRLNALFHYMVDNELTSDNDNFVSLIYMCADADLIAKYILSTASSSVSVTEIGRLIDSVNDLRAQMDPVVLYSVIDKLYTNLQASTDDQFLSQVDSNTRVRFALTVTLSLLQFPVDELTLRRWLTITQPMLTHSSVRSPQLLDVDLSQVTYQEFESVLSTKLLNSSSHRFLGLPYPRVSELLFSYVDEHNAVDALKIAAHFAKDAEPDLFADLLQHVLQYACLIVTPSELFTPYVKLSPRELATLVPYVHENVNEAAWRILLDDHAPHVNTLLYVPLVVLRGFEYEERGDAFWWNRKLYEAILTIAHNLDSHQLPVFFNIYPTYDGCVMDLLKAVGCVFSK